LVHTKFGLSLTESLIEELALHHDSIMEAFYNCFMALSCHDLGITEVHPVQLIMTGLDQPLQTGVTL
jgi:hypothetical protein